MNMFDQTHALVHGHFIGYYTVNYSFLKDNFEKQKQCGTSEVTCFNSDVAECYHSTQV